jgi:hypothetical protein
MADPTYTTYAGTGEVVSADFKTVKWVGMTKSGKALEITLTNAINMENPNLTFAEKDDVVQTLVFEACYDNTDATASSTAEPFTIKVEDTVVAGASEILPGKGIFYIGEVPVALCRGGGSFTVEREYRNQNADGDRGTVKGRVVMEGSKPKLTMNALTWITKITTIWPAFAVQA